MQKLAIFQTITIFIATIITPIRGMEKPSLTTTEIPQLIVALHLIERTQKKISNPTYKSFNKADQHACTVLGIAWEENNNRYLTQYAFIRRLGDTKSLVYDKCWVRNFPIDILPLTTIPNMSLAKSYQCYVKFPATLPATFVEKLKQEKNIKLENTHFAEPVDIIIELDDLRLYDPKDTSYLY